MRLRRSSTWLPWHSGRRGRAIRTRTARPQTPGCRWAGRNSVGTWASPPRCCTGAPAGTRGRRSARSTRPRPSARGSTGPSTGSVHWSDRTGSSSLCGCSRCRWCTRPRRRRRAPRAGISCRWTGPCTGATRRCSPGRGCSSSPPCGGTCTPSSTMCSEGPDPTTSPGTCAGRSPRGVCQGSRSSPPPCRARPSGSRPAPGRRGTPSPKAPRRSRTPGRGRSSSHTRRSRPCSRRRSCSRTAPARRRPGPSAGASPPPRATRPRRPAASAWCWPASAAWLGAPQTRRWPARRCRRCQGGRTWSRSS
mmetsp:Transcript_26544/g.69279  ORF Transcript_26544/g.69279 Transcript_26544/m.69279 type:complete len:306 (-) Transcript_26544:609-1526(-)